MVHDGRNPVVRADRQKLRPELLAGADVDRNDLIGKPEFLQHDRDFPAVRRRRIMQVDHGTIRGGSWDDPIPCFGRILPRAVIMYAMPRTWQIDRPDKKTRGYAHAFSNHDRRLPADTGMAGRAQYIMGALEIVRRGAGPRQARRH